jgi:hypothetical protein
MLLFAGFHLLLGGALFGFIVWFLLGDAGDVDDGEDDGGTRVPRPWRPSPRPTRVGPTRRAVVRVPNQRTRPRSRAR